MDNNNFMNGDFETDFFSPLPQEEPAAQEKKEKKKMNKKVLIGVIAAVVVAALAIVVVLAVSAGNKEPKERFIQGMEGLKAELEKPGPSWMDEVGYEAIEEAMYTDAMSTDIELNLTMPQQLTVGLDILHNSDYPEKVSNTNVEVSVYNVPLVEADITLDEDMWYISLPELIDEVYSVNGATLGKDYNASGWAYEFFGLPVMEDYVWQGFMGPQVPEEEDEELDAMLSEGIEKIKENMVVEEKNAKGNVLTVVLQKDDINDLMEDIFGALEDGGYMAEEEMYWPALAQDVELSVTFDKKDRIVELSTIEPITFEDESIGEIEFELSFDGKKNVTDSMEMVFSMEMEETTGGAVVKYEKRDEDDICESDLSMVFTVDDGDETVEMEMDFLTEWNQAEKEFEGSISASMYDESFSAVMKGSFKDIVQGEQFTMDLKKLSFSYNDEEMFKITGEVAVAPFEGEIEIPEESINVFSLSETEMDDLLTEIIDGIYAKILGE